MLWQELVRLSQYCPAPHELDVGVGDVEGVEEFTHALPFQYWPEVQSVVDVGVQLEPFQYWPDGHDEVVWPYPDPLPLQPEIGALVQLLIWVVLGMT